jgi:Uncharacterized conserved protein
MKKTNAMRLLDSLGIGYEPKEYECDGIHLDAISASHNAGIDPELVFKTIVMKGASNTLYVFVTPAEFEIKPKKAKSLTGEKDLALLPLDDLLKYTGYIRGGCSPLGMIHRYRTFISDLAQLEDKIYVSAGMRGMQLCLAPDDLRTATDGEFADFT